MTHGSWKMTYRTLYLCAAASLGLSAAAQASTVVAFSEVELARRSHAIFMGSVLSIETHVNERNQVLTRATVQVYRAVRGILDGESVVVQVPGGMLPNGLVAHTYGSPKLVPGELIFGFFELNHGTYRPIALSLGLLRVRQTPEGEFRLSRDVSGLGLVRPDGDSVDPKVFQIEDEPMEALIGRIKTYTEGVVIPPPVGTGGVALP